MGGFFLRLVALSIPKLKGLSWFTMVYHGLSWFIMVYHGLDPHFPGKDNFARPKKLTAMTLQGTNGFSGR
jgi:hypothetical protein